MKQKAHKPIGVFDSGIGGLTIAKAISNALPNESLIYFGDTLHLPYGDKPAGVVCDYVKKIADFLLEREVKLIVVACNSASAAAHEMLKTYIGKHALLVDVIDPVVTFLNQNYMHQRLGLIGTKLTVESAIYQQQLSSEIELCPLATPLLVPIIEEGFAKRQLLDAVLVPYLQDPKLRNIQALVLGCTHYSFIKDEIADFYQGKASIIDGSQIVANKVGEILGDNKLLATGPATHNFYVSRYNDNLFAKTHAFFGAKTAVEELNI